jgi:hypothetical protein
MGPDRDVVILADDVDILIGRARDDIDVGIADKKVRHDIANGKLQGPAAGVELAAGVWFPEPVREMTIFAEQYDFAVTLLLLENQYRYTQLDREPKEDVYARSTSGAR